MTGHLGMDSGRIHENQARLRRLALLALLLALSTRLVGQTVDQARWFDIPSLPLESALLLFSEQAGIQVLVDARLIDARTSPAMTGRYPPMTVLASLIEGRSLRYQLISENTIVISADPDQRPPHPIEVDGRLVPPVSMPGIN